MPSPITVNVPNGQNAQIWSGRQVPGISSVLIQNTDLLSTIYIGTQSNIMPPDNVWPVPPNGSISVDASDNWYVTGSADGISPVVILPNGTSSFRGVTQGQGALAIPAVFSPDYVPHLQGWMIGQDGSAEFNDLDIRGTFSGTDFEINSDGIFFYQ